MATANVFQRLRAFFMAKYRTQNTIIQPIVRISMIMIGALKIVEMKILVIKPIRMRRKVEKFWSMEV